MFHHVGAVARMGGRKRVRASPSAPTPGTRNATAGPRAESVNPKLMESKVKLASVFRATAPRKSVERWTESRSSLNACLPAVCTRAASTSPNNVRSDACVPVRRSSTPRRFRCACCLRPATSTSSVCAKLSHGPCTSMTSISSLATVGGGSLSLFSAGSTGSARGFARFQAVASRDTVPSWKMSNESLSMISRRYARALANDASSKSCKSSEMNTS